MPIKTKLAARIPAPPVIAAGVESESVTIVSLLNVALLLVVLFLLAAPIASGSLRIDYVLCLEDGGCCQYARCTEVTDGFEDTSCAIADGGCKVSS